MEPVTHILTGAVLGRAGLNRRTAYATLAMAIAAELPDIDTLWSFGGPLTGFEHHRGITHTFVAVPVQAALMTAAFYLYHRWRGRAGQSFSAGWLFGGTVLALLSHLLLDWTNNYGLRPFFPFNPRWYAGSFVFIFEPVLFLILLAALTLPALFSLINAEVGARRSKLRGRPAAIAALLAIAALYSVRGYEHHQALETLAHRPMQSDAPLPERLFASPHPINPFLWAGVVDRDESTQLFTVHSNTQRVDSPSPGDTLYKTSSTLPVLVAKRSELGRIYLDWSMDPVLSETPDTSDPNHPLTRVTFADARFLYDISFFRGREKPPISGSVLLDMQAPEGQRVVETEFNGKVQR